VQSTPSDGEAEFHDSKEPAGGDACVVLDVVEDVHGRLVLATGDEFLQVCQRRGLVEGVAPCVESLTCA
jgi:hypothetical protein